MTQRSPAPAEMDLDEFRRMGYLQEINRRFLHPLGLALALERVDGHATGRIKVWDGTDDPEGFVFNDLTPENCARGEAIEADLQLCLGIREEAIGFGVQPLRPIGEVAGQ